MKKMIFSGYLANDKDCFIEISLCSYDYKNADGKKCYIPYVCIFESSPQFPNGDLCQARSADDLVSYVKAQQMCKSDVEKMIDAINKHPFEAIAIFGTEADSHLVQRLREVALDDDYFDELPPELLK